MFVVGSYGTIYRWDGAYPEGVRISAPKQVFPGDVFQVKLYLDNPGDPIADVLLFLALEIGGEYWFWDDWQLFDSEDPSTLDWRQLDLVTGTTTIQAIPPVEWPETGYSLDELWFHSAMLRSDTGELIGNVDSIKWRFSM